MEKKDEKVYLLTDLCMWEGNKKNGTFYPHAIEVVDEETGAVHFIKSGSRISFVRGEISARATQEAYNQKAGSSVSDNKQSVSKRKTSKRKSETA